MCVQYRLEGADGKGRNHTSKSPLCVTVQRWNCQSSSAEPMGALGESLGLSGGVKSTARQCVYSQVTVKKRQAVITQGQHV